MADAFTPNLNLTKPDVGHSDDTWGVKLNSNFDILDTAIGGIGIANGNKGDITVSNSGLTWLLNPNSVGSTELEPTSVTPGSYTNASITVDADGRITLASSGAPSGIPDADYGDINISGGIWTIDNDVVNNAKLANVSPSTIKGRITGGIGDPEDLTAAQVRTLINVADGANNYTHPNHIGDVTSIGDGATTLVDNAVSTNKLLGNAVTFPKMQDINGSRFLGRMSVGLGDPEEVTGTQATTLLDLFTSSLKGLVPPSGGGTANFLRADGTFAVPPGGVSTLAFGTVQVSGQSDVVADTSPDTLTLIAGTNVTITTNPATDAITIAASTGSSTVAFGTIQVAGQSDVVADAAPDILTLIAGANITITTNAATDAITIAAGTPFTSEEAQDAVGTILIDTASIDFTYNDATPSITAAVLPAGVNHNALLNFVANEHINHTAVVLTAGAGITGGGDISLSRTFAVGAGTGITVNADDVALDTANTRNVDHAAVTLTAGAGLTGGGTIAANRTFDIGQGAGIAVAADAVALDINNLTVDTPVLADSFAFFDASGADTNKATLTTLNGILSITALSGYVANEHINHTSVVLTAGAGLTGGGDISANRTFAVGAGVGIAVNADDVALNFNALTADVPVSGDLFPFFDISGADHNNVTLAGLATALLGLNSASTQILFNSGGNIAGDADLTYNNATNTISLASNGTFQIGSAIQRSVGGTMTFINDAATANTVEPVLLLTRSSTGTPTVGVGGSLQIQVEAGVNNFEIGGEIQSVATDTTNTVEDFDMRFLVMANGIRLENFRLSARPNHVRAIFGDVSSGRGATSRLELATDNNSENAIIFTAFGASAFGHYETIIRTRGAGPNAEAILLNNDNLSQAEWYGSDGSVQRLAAKHTVKIDGTPGANDMPTSHIFSARKQGGTTTADVLRLAGLEVNPLVRMVENEVILTDAANITLDASAGNTHKIVAAGDRTLLAPTVKPVSGQVQKMVVAFEASGANRTLSLQTGVAGGFRFGSDITGLTATVSGKTDYIGFVYNDAADRWDVVSYSKGY